MSGSNVVSISDRRDVGKRWPADVFGWKNRTRFAHDVALSDMADQTGSVAEIDWDLVILWNQAYADAARKWSNGTSRNIADYFSRRPSQEAFRNMIDRLPRSPLRAVEHLQEDRKSVV